jgi:hypothetical protein
MCGRVGRMKLIPIFLGTASAVSILGLVGWTASGESAVPVAPPAGSLELPVASPVVSITIPSVTAPEPTVTPAEEGRRAMLSGWLVDAMESWSQVPRDEALTPRGHTNIDVFVRWHHEPVESFVGRLNNVADALAASGATMQEASDLAAIAFEESGFRRYVDDGTCNTNLGLPLPRGESNCDSGLAYTIFQLRPDLWWTPIGGHVVTGAELLSSREFATAKALEKYRSNPAGWATWPRARELASRWRTKHPL